MSEFEQQVVGAILMDSARITEVDCTPDHFESGFYREIFRTITEMSLRNEPIDTLTVAEQMERRTGKDWLASVAAVANNAIAAKNLKPYSDEIKLNHVKRQAAAIATELLRTLDRGGMESVDAAIAELMDLGNASRQTVFTIKEALRQSMDHLGRVMDGEKPAAISTGFHVLDENLGGLHDTDLIVIGARPSMGKTAFLQNLILNCGEPCGFISTEQSAKQMADRFLCIQGGIEGWKLRRGKIGENDWAAMNAATALLVERRIFIDEESQPTIADVQRQARRWRQQYGIKALFVDYIQRVDGTNPKATTTEQVTQVAKGLKSIARELNIPVVALAQVNRGVDSRADKRPGMGDLSDSSAIEKEADQIIMLYRDEVYNPETDQAGIAELIVEKNRHGPTNFVRLGWNGANFRFTNLSENVYHFGSRGK